MSAPDKYLPQSPQNLGGGFSCDVLELRIPSCTGPPPARTASPDHGSRHVSGHVSRLPPCLSTQPVAGAPSCATGAPRSPYDLTLSPLPTSEGNASDAAADPLRDIAGHFCDTSDPDCGIPSSDSEFYRELLAGNEPTGDHKAYVAGRCPRGGPVSPRYYDSDGGTVPDVTTVHY